MMKQIVLTAGLLVILVVTGFGQGAAPRHQRAFFSGGKLILGPGQDTTAIAYAPDMSDTLLAIWDASSQGFVIGTRSKLVVPGFFFDDSALVHDADTVFRIDDAGDILFRAFIMEGAVDMGGGTNWLFNLPNIDWDTSEVNYASYAPNVRMVLALLDGFLSLSGGAITGAIIFDGGSLSLPTATAPSLTTEGQVAWDSDDDGVVVHDGTSQRFMSSLRTLNIALTHPDGLEIDSLILFHFDPLLFPNGAKIVQVALTSKASISYTLPIAEWSDETGSTKSLIHSLSLSTATRVEVSGGSITDSDIAADAWLYCYPPATVAEAIHIEVIYYAK